MTASAALSAFGKTLTWDGALIAEITNLGMPSMKADSIDITSEDSDDSFREFLAGLRDGGEISIEFNFIPGDTTGQIAMAADFAAGATKTATIALPAAAATAWTFNGFLTAFSMSGAMDGKLMGAATIKITGNPVLSVTASADITTIVYTDSVGVKTSLPVFASSTYAYSVTIATGSSWIKLTVTDATAATIKVTCLGVEHLLTSGAISEQITVGAAATSTPLTVVVTDTGKVAKTYTVLVVRP